MDRQDREDMTYITRCAECGRITWIARGENVLAEGRALRRRLLRGNSAGYIPRDVAKQQPYGCICHDAP